MKESRGFVRYVTVDNLLVRLRCRWRAEITWRAIATVPTGIGAGAWLCRGSHRLHVKKRRDRRFGLEKSWGGSRVLRINIKINGGLCCCNFYCFGFFFVFGWRWSRRVFSELININHIFLLNSCQEVLHHPSKEVADLAIRWSYWTYNINSKTFEGNVVILSYLLRNS